DGGPERLAVSSAGGAPARAALRVSADHLETRMGAINVLSPVGINRMQAQPPSPRLAELRGARLGLLNNSKPDSLLLQQRVVELLGRSVSLGPVVTKQKPSAAIGADKLDVYAREVDAVVTAIGD